MLNPYYAPRSCCLIGQDYQDVEDRGRRGRLVPTNMHFRLMGVCKGAEGQQLKSTKNLNCKLLVTACFIFIRHK